MTSVLASNVIWPPRRVPIEIYILIAEYLDRSDVRSLRLVGREFYRNLSGYYLRQLVVQVGPDLCATLGTGTSREIGASPIDLTNRLVDNSYVFRSYGDQIRRFALALEMTEPELASPKVPDDEVICVRQWGVYRWPAEPKSSKKSHLQAAAEALEKSKGLFRILSHLEQVQELALSCEGGLGYLQGPDITTPPRRPIIFGDESRIETSEAPYQVDFETAYAYDKLEQMVRNADISTEPIHELAAKLIKREGVTLQEFGGEDRARCPLPACRRDYKRLRCSTPSRECCKKRADTLRLQPDMLTQYQKLFLSQHIMAQQALIHSYLLGVMDNASSFKNLTKLKIASLPSFHIDQLCRHDFWNKLAMLEEISLAVVPDWRALTQCGSRVEDIQVYPADAIPKVFRLLDEYIGKQQHIKRLHFEWLCGGELASGSCQRNQNVLPGPFLKNHRKVIDSRLENLLVLPHVTHLSLKNCWFTPHTFYRIVREMALKSLVSLELVTVSLSGPPIERTNPDLQNLINALQQNNGAPPNNGLLLTNGVLPNGILIQNPATIPADSTQPMVYPPFALSWGHVIDMLSPSTTIREYIHERTRSPSTPALRVKNKLKLRRLAFKSCGYVEVPDGRFVASWPFEGYNRSTIERSLPPDYSRLNGDCRCVNFFMQANTDRHLGRVVGGMPRAEMDTLRQVFGFRFGWRGAHGGDDDGDGDSDGGGEGSGEGSGDAHMLFGKAAFDGAQRDGTQAPGRGRFTGIIERQTEEMTPVERYAGIFYPKEEKEEGDGEDRRQNADGVVVSRLTEILDTRPYDGDYDDGGGTLEALVKRLEMTAYYRALNESAGLDGLE